MRTPTRPPRFTHWTLSDGYVVHGRAWDQPAPPTGVGVLYLHGIQSHGGWFEGSASALADCGLPVWLPDRRGSGLNAAPRGDTPSADRWLDDLDELADAMAADCGVRRIALVGVSWGGKLAVCWAARRPERVATLMLVAPGLFSALDVSIWTKLSIGFSAAWRGGQPFPIPLDNPALFTQQSTGQAFIRADHLRLRCATARFFVQSAALDRRVRAIKPDGLAVPATIALAEQDAIICNAKTRTWAARAIRGAEIVSFPGTAHTIEFEPEYSTLCDVFRQWAVAAAGRTAQVLANS